MTDLHKITAAFLLNSASFWLVTFVLYLGSRGLSEGSIFVLLGIYYAGTVILEYPTGVIGDHYSHKLSVILGYLTLVIAFFLVSFAGSFLYYLAVLLFASVGTTLVSGSDTALFHAVSRDFKKDYANVTSYSMIVSFACISVGGYVASLDLRYPLYLTALSLLLASLFLYGVNDPHRDMGSANVFDTAKKGLRHTIRDAHLRNILTVSMLFGGFFISMKWLYNPLFVALGFDVKWWGILSGIAILLVAGGSKLFGSYSRVSGVTIAMLIFGSMLLMGATGMPMIAVSGLFAAHLLRGYFDTQLMVDITDAIPDGLRSSILSLRSLVVRGVGVVFVVISGFVLDHASFIMLMIIFVTFLIVLGAYPMMNIRFGQRKNRVFVP